MFKWIRKNSLVIVGLGLMLASSGLDGAYMSKWMSKDLWFLGYVLNTVSDITGFVLTYWYGIFQQSKDETKRQMSKMLLVGEVVGIVYSWAFSWRQLRFVMPMIETNPISGSQWEVEIVSFVAAGFIPLTLALVGYAQSMQVTSEDLELDAPKPKRKEVENVKVENEQRQAQPVKTDNVSLGETDSEKPSIDKANIVRSKGKEERVKAMLDLYAENPDLTQGEVAEVIGVSRPTVSNYLSEVEGQGLVKRNGSGVQVIGGVR
jgi:predicted XRE-type DNA-binding protein